MSTTTWPVLQPNLDTILAEEPNPIERLADGSAAAVLIRQAFDREECKSLIRFLIDHGLMYESGDDRIDEKANSAVISDRYLGKGLNPEDSPRRRIDIGASLGNAGDDKEQFLALSTEAQNLFDRLFAGRQDPIAAIYDNLQKLAPQKRVVTAFEPDGRKYGPAIFRIHYGGFTYGPHFDSVRNREKRENYAVYDYQTQLAGVLCLQNSTLNATTAQGILHRQFWNEEIDPLLASGKFPDYATRHDVTSVQVDLEPGDLYFFNTGLIHEVPGVAGDLPRVVLATFIGYSDDKDDIMVWS